MYGFFGCKRADRTESVLLNPPFSAGISPILEGWMFDNVSGSTLAGLRDRSATASAETAYSTLNVLRAGFTFQPPLRKAMILE
jgi:hypothetical protein